MLSRPRRLSGFSALAATAAVAMLVLVAVGGAVRATESGLACPTWPGCFFGGDFLPALQFNVWLEHSHRLLAGLVAVLLGAQFAWALARYRSRPAILWASATAFVAVLVQAGLGAMVVLHLLAAELVTAHLGMAMLVVACQLYIAVASAEGVEERGSDYAPAGLSAGVAVLTLVQILIGGHVSGIGAGLAYVGPEFPFLGLVSFTPATTPQEWLNIVHRVLAAGLLLAVGMLAARARRAGATGWLLTLPRLAFVLVVLQALIGVANLATGLSPLSVIPHLAVASWIWATVVLHTVLAWRGARVRSADRQPAAVPVGEPA
jgi:heme A synthase